MYTRIVVPLDGSELAERDLPHAENLARLTGSPLDLLRVVDFTRLECYGPYGLALEYAALDQIRATEQTAGEEYLATVRRDLTDRGLTATSEIRSGLVRQEIAAATQPGDIVVMASHGRSGIPRWFLGSVAEEVVRHSAVPVMLVRALSTGGETGAAMKRG